MLSTHVKFYILFLSIFLKIIEKLICKIILQVNQMLFLKDLLPLAHSSVKWNSHTGKDLGITLQCAKHGVSQTATWEGFLLFDYMMEVWDTGISRRPEHD